MLIQGQPLTHGLWLLTDDTEEDLVGSDLHQDVIDAAYEGVWLAGPQHGHRWHVGRQLMLLIPDVGSGKDWHPSPDLMVHPDADPAPLTAFDTRTLGMPPLLLEVASPSTVAYDRGAKRNGYFLAGVQEYLVFDPAAEWIPEQVEAWRRDEAGEVVPWRPTAGRWHSATVGISFAIDGRLLRIYDASGEPMPTFREQEQLRAQHQRELAEQQRTLAEQHQVLTEQHQMLSEQHQVLTEQQRALAEQQRALAEQQLQLAEQQRELSDQQRELVERTRRIADLESRLRALGHQP